MNNTRTFRLMLFALLMVALSIQLATALPVTAVNTSKAAGNQTESFIVINPTNPLNIVAFSNEDIANSTFRAYSFDGGSTWTGGDINVNAACCDGQAVAFDSFGNLFLVYISASVGQVNVVVSTDGGVNFSSPTTVGTGGIDQPSIAAGDGSLWVDWNQNGNMVAKGAPVTGLGVFGPFGSQQSIPSASGSFGGIAVGPGANGTGKVMVVYQSPTSGEGPATIYVNTDPDGLGSAGFGSRVTVTSTNVGGFDFIPAQSGRSIDAESGLAWDVSGGTFDNRVYLVYTDEDPNNESNDTNIYVRTSDDNGATWSSRIRVNDDATTRSQFNPYISVDPKTGAVGVTFHDCRNDTGVPGTGGTNNTPNDDAQYFATYSTNGGATWATNVQLSCGFSNAADANNGIDYGDYVGTSSYCGVLFGAWADNSNCTGDNPAGTLSTFDLYAMALPIYPVDLSINNSDGGATTAPGATISYTLTYGNAGRLSTGVVLSDTVPANTTFNAGASTAGWSCSPNGNAGSVCTLNIGTVSGCGGSGSAVFAVTVDNPLPVGVTLITNNANIHDDGTNGADANPSNNFSTDTTPVVLGPDLSLTKDDGGASVNPGGTVAYTLGYSNNGVAGATGVVVAETVPANSTFNAGSSTAGWSCPNGSGAGTLCQLTIGILDAGASGSAQFAIDAVTPVPAGVDAISNTASLSGNEPDPTPADNTATDTTPLVAAPDLSITKTDGGATAVPGGDVTYTLGYSNAGNQDATGVVLTDTVPANSTFDVGASTLGWSCAPDVGAGSTCTLSISALPAGGTGSATYTVTVDASLPVGVTQISNSASIADDGTNGADPTPGDNSASDTTPVNIVQPCLFCDDFEDGVLAPPGVWTYTRPGWSESSGTLIGTISSHKTTAVATPIFAGCLTCYVESTMESVGGPFSRISMLGWYVDKKNNVELMMDAERGRWVLKQRAGGKVIRKQKVVSAINPGQFYTARITFDGTNYIVTIDGVSVITIAPGAVVPGTVGFRVKATTGAFGYVEVN